MTFQQWIVGFGVTMLVMQIGFLVGWLSPTLAKLTASNSPLPLTLDQASWIASLTSVGNFFGAIAGSVLTITSGCKRTIFVTLWPIAIGWFFVIVANSVEWLYVSRLALGAATGMMLASFPLYIGEVSIPEIRGALVAAPNVGAAFGKVVASICGSNLNLSTAALIYFSQSILLMFFFYWLPESPHHLIKVGNRKEAEKSIYWYRNGREVIKELEAVEKFVGDTSKQSFTEKCREFRRLPVRKATFQTVVLFIFMNICGLNSVVLYMETILRNAQFTLFNPATLVILINSAGILASAASSFFIDRFGRKFSMIISSLGVSVALVMLSAQFFFIKLGILNLPWLPMIAVFLFVISYFLGLMSVPSCVLSEMFPANIKGIAALIAGLTASASAFLASKTYQPMLDILGESCVYLIYAVFALLAVPYTVFFVIETKGKTLSEIQEDLKWK